MPITINTPNITATSDRERLQQMQSYLYQMANQLQWAFSTLETGTTGVVQSAPPQTARTGDGTLDNPKATFAALKDLIIKSADIVEAYYDTISAKLDGLYVAQSDFGTFVEETHLQLEGTSTAINQIYSNEQTIITDLETLGGNTEALSGKVDGLTEQNKELGENLDELYQQTLLTNAYIKTGLLYYKDDATPVYGLEIGQTNSVDGATVFDKFARFAADRLSFFDSNDVEVAYISDYKLYITNAEISGSLWLSGKFKIYYNGGLAFQWIGGES
jgi:hypothetical protein